MKFFLITIFMMYGKGGVTSTGPFENQIACEIAGRQVVQAASVYSSSSTVVVCVAEGVKK